VELLLLYHVMVTDAKKFHAKSDRVNSHVDMHYYYTKICSETIFCPYTHTYMPIYVLLNVIKSHTDGVCKYRNVPLKTNSGTVVASLSGASIA
jgi:hypothetical protein